MTFDEMKDAVAAQPPGVLFMGPSMVKIMQKAGLLSLGTGGFWVYAASCCQAHDTLMSIMPDDSVAVRRQAEADTPETGE